MLKYILSIGFALTTLLVFAQDKLPPVAEGLIAYYSFDDCLNLGKDDTGGGSDGVMAGNPSCVCGVSGNAIELDGLNDYMIFPGPINNYFDIDEITISFYFKSFDNPLVQTIISKSDKCGPDNSLEINYQPNRNAVTAKLSETQAKFTENFGTLDFSECWHHVVLVRRHGRAYMYLDGKLVNEERAISRIDIENNGVFSLAGGPCVGAGTNRFKGYIDELAIYSTDLTIPKPYQLYLNPDDITTKDQTVYLGDFLDIETSTTCRDNYTFSWTPADNVENPDIDTTRITPTETATYRLNFKDENGCVSFDTIRLTVVDPNLLNCEEVYLPKAFSPNGHGPEENETFGISNYRSVPNVTSFEIVDRWGAVMFKAESPSDRWDGTFRGQQVDSGVYLYKVEYECDGETKTKFGGVNLMR